MQENLKFAGRKLMIAVPAYDGKIAIQSAFAFVAFAAAAQKIGLQFEMAQASGCAIISKARNILVSQFMKSDCTDLLFVDSDVMVTPEAILKLMAVSEWKDITAGVYPNRDKNQKFCLQVFLDEFGKLEFDKNGMMRVLGIGTGFMLIGRHVLQGMMDKRPELAYQDGSQTHYALFDFELKDGKYIGEDYTFCHRAQENGYSVFIDPNICLGHIGSHEFKSNFEESVLNPLLKEMTK